MSASADRWVATGTGPAKVLAAARERLQNGHVGDRVRLTVELDERERAQVGRLLGVAWEASAKAITLGNLRAGLAALDDDLVAVLTRHGGAPDNLRAKRAANLAARTATINAAYEALIAAGWPAHAVDHARAKRWLERANADHVPERADELCRLWKALPSDNRPLPQLADALFDDTHCLDRGQTLGRLAARLLAAAGAAPTEAAEAVDQALTATSWRRTWASFGVLCDEVSSTVLVLGLPLVGDSPAADLSSTAARRGEPLWLTSRSLRGAWRPHDDVHTVRVCENPSIVEAAADEHGTASLPLVCVYGRPSSAAWALLGGLAGAGVRLLISADRDTAGRRFAAEMLRLRGAEPWLPEIDGIFEESRLPELLADLRSAVHR
ncbi:TIGR02679 domain-containing protein [Micromonospora aurantiaca]|uniref:TIGR02679 domain-containing protein n=1 Tax=Micromonospora aurantiaca (nom. illeg.) TaxID=47850 RepID=UPI0011A3A2B7|nr:TIGR02679 domain-containing protein [Micromonospora aurantiaca]UFN96260.1 TIGR02679 domain-containing protein [Micromonospora aurantiaca]